MKSADRWYLAALVCGLTPLSIGVAIYGLWSFFFWPWLALAGLLNILCGLGAVAIGAVCLIVYVVRARAVDPRPRLVWRILSALAALLFNFPAALAIICLVSGIRVIVANGGPAIDRLVIISPCWETDFGAIPAGTRRTVVLEECEGSLTFRAVRDSGETTGEIAGYVTSPYLDVFWLRFLPDGTWSVGEQTRP